MNLNRKEIIKHMIRAKGSCNDLCFYIDNCDPCPLHKECYSYDGIANEEVAYTMIMVFAKEELTQEKLFEVLL